MRPRNCTPLLIGSLLLTCASVAAQALDIPMRPELVEAALDSKTCFSTLSSRGRLVGYELAEDLLASSGGKVVVLPTVNRAEVGDKMPRIYEGAGIRVVVEPRSTSRASWHPEEEEVRETARLTITGAGKRRTLTIAVYFTCSP